MSEERRRTSEGVDAATFWQARAEREHRWVHRLEDELAVERERAEVAEARVAALTQESERLRTALTDRAERLSDLGREIRSLALDERIALAVEEQAEDTLAALDGLVGLHEQEQK